jgi:hypothetical protein
VDGGVDLVGRQTAAPHGHPVSVEDIADRASFDTESVAQFVGCRAGQVFLDEGVGLVGVESACAPSWTSAGG